MPNRAFLRLPVVSTGAEYLVMGHLMRRNILTYKAPEGNEGYDLICIHPDPRYKAGDHELTQARIQVKSRYATDCDRGFPIKEKALDAFDFLIVAFLNIGKRVGWAKALPRPWVLVAIYQRRAHHKGLLMGTALKGWWVFEGLRERLCPSF